MVFAGLLAECGVLTLKRDITKFKIVALEVVGRGGETQFYVGKNVMLIYFCIFFRRTSTKAKNGNRRNIYDWLIWVALMIPSKHETLIQCWLNVEPASKTMGQHLINIGC